MASASALETASSPRVVASLTTIPSGLSGAIEVIQRLLGEPELTVIYLNLPLVYGKTGEAYPEPPRELLEHPRVKILRDPDLGPITKIYPVLKVEKDPSTMILILDDDHLPEPGIVEKFLTYSKLYPNSALTTGGWVRGSGVAAYQCFVDVLDKVYPVDWVEGSGGIFASRKIFGDENDLIDYSFLEGELLRLFKKHDDHWLSWRFSARGVPRWSIPVFFGNVPTKSQKSVNISGDWKFKVEVYEISTWLQSIGIYSTSPSFRASLPITTKITLFGIGLGILLLVLFSRKK